MGTKIPTPVSEALGPPAQLLPLPRPVPKSRHDFIKAYHEKARREKVIWNKAMEILGTYKLINTKEEPMRTRLPDTRKSITHKFDISGHEGYITVGLYEDGKPGELFITMAKEGSTVSGLMDTVGILTSLALQHGVPLESITSKLRHSKFEPLEKGKCSSVIDYIFKWMDAEFDGKEN